MRKYVISFFRNETIMEVLFYYEKTAQTFHSAFRSGFLHFIYLGMREEGGGVSVHNDHMGAYAGGYSGIGGQ